MLVLALIMSAVGVWLFDYALGQTFQLFFPPLPGDEPIPAEYFTRHRGFIIRSALTGYALAVGYALAAWWTVSLAGE